MKRRRFLPTILLAPEVAAAIFASAGCVKPDDAGVPTLDRLRGIERRPPTGDVEEYVQRLIDEHANAVTLGTMNGRGYVFFPSEAGTPVPDLDPERLPAVIRRLREERIDVLSWVVFNVQDVRKVEEFVTAERFPEWRMEFIEEPGREPLPRVGMCVVSSPYIEHHAKVLRECAEFDLDGFFFDGFYFGGIPHPSRPGCVCRYCAERFRADTGLEIPKVVDWTSQTFKRWVRWRNERLWTVARYFQSQIREVNPRATCTFNYNIWPFSRKDWETAIPAWKVEDFGVSQHGFSRRFHEKWLEPGFKARIGRDINPQHTDMWRSCGFNYTCPGGEPDLAWHELEIRNFLLTALSHGITPWHSTVEGPVELTARIHDEIAKRERHFSREHIANVAVLYSQDTHDFYGHIPGTENLATYRDGILGTWMLLTENHVPFEFVFENQIDRGVPGGYGVLILPNAAALSAEAVGNIADWVKAGGCLIATSETSAYDEWGDKLAEWRFQQALGAPLAVAAGSREIGRGRFTYLPEDPGFRYCRERDPRAVASLLEALRGHELPFEVEAPAHLVVNMFRNPSDSGELWVHLLNVSPFMPGGDTGFRGLDRPPAPVVFETNEEGRRLGGPLIPAKNVSFRLLGRQVKSARLAVAGTDIAAAKDGTLMIPEIAIHDILVLRTATAGA